MRQHVVEVIRGSSGESGTRRTILKPLHLVLGKVHTRFNEWAPEDSNLNKSSRQNICIYTVHSLDWVSLKCQVYEGLLSPNLIDKLRQSRLDVSTTMMRISFLYTYSRLHLPECSVPKALCGLWSHDFGPPSWLGYVGYTIPKYERVPFLPSRNLLS